MTGGDTQGTHWSKWCRYPIVIAQCINRTSCVLRRMVRTPGGIVIHRTSRKPLLCERER